MRNSTLPATRRMKCFSPSDLSWDLRWCSSSELSEEEEAERTALVHELYGKQDPGGYVSVLAGADGAEMNAAAPEASFGEAEGEVFEEESISPAEESVSSKTSEDEEK